MSDRQFFHPAIDSWFSAHVGTPTSVQSLSWPVIREGKNTLISAPTGTGKTLSAFLVFIDKLYRLREQNRLEDRVYVLYITPLKALGNDIQKNLMRPLREIPCEDIRVAIRNGDTEPSERRRMIKQPPHILITTPESLYLLLSSKSGLNLLKGIESVVIDEMHALIDTKRGAHLMLSLSRLAALLGGNLQRVALSATISPLERAAEYLSTDGETVIVAPSIQKDVDVQVQLVVPDLRELTEGSIWPHIARAVARECESARSVIAFLEGRAQAEKLAYGVNAIEGEGFARTHHGCVSKEQRLEAEQQLKSGQLKLMCATSSMELGIDVGEIDLVLQVGTPMTVSGLLQRLGRAGHNPGRVSNMRVYPKMATDILYAGMTVRAALDGLIEEANPPRDCLDIVAQHVVSMAAQNVYTVGEILGIVHGSVVFQGVTREMLISVLSMLAGDFEHAQDRPARPRILYDRIHDTVYGDDYSRMLAVSSGGTIPDRGWFPVVLADGTRLGELDEEYVFEARVGDVFTLGAFSWRMLEIQRDKVLVESAPRDGAQIPFWRGDGRGRSYRIGCKFGEYLRTLNDAHTRGNMDAALRKWQMDDYAISNLSRLVKRQVELCGCLSNDRVILIEHFSDAAGANQMMVHSVFGRRVNQGIEMLLAHAAQQATGYDIHTYSDDDGILLYLMGTAKLPNGLLYEIDPNEARERIAGILPSTPLFFMSFRYNAARALMMGVRKGGRLPLWVQRLKGAEVLSDVAAQEGHPLMIETERECLNDYLDLDAVFEVLTKIHSGEIAVMEFDAPEPSPLSLPMRRQVEADMMYMYNPIPKAAHKKSDRELDLLQGIRPVQEAIDAQYENRRAIKDEEGLHAHFMAEGDIVAGEVDAPVQWLITLSRAGRAVYIEPGLWIAKEHEEFYEQALTLRDEEVLKRLFRRALRYRGAQNAQSLSERYQLDEEEIEPLLMALTKEGAAVKQDDVYYHADVYERAQQKSVMLRRQEAATVKDSCFAALLASSVRTQGSAAVQMKAAVESCLGRAYPLDQWEKIILPARVANYRPKLLNDLLTMGEFVYRIIPAERMMVQFVRQDDIDWNAGIDLGAEELSEDESAVLQALSRRGAMFSHALSPLVTGNITQVLIGLLSRGLLHSDSFEPVRLLQDAIKEKGNAKNRSKRRVLIQDSGRFEIARPLKETSLEEKIERAFSACPLICREVVEGMAFREALDILRIQEYTGRVRRGYYVKGLSGAQFIREEDYRRTTMRLKNPTREIVWLSAIDPAQAWGRYLKHREEASFMLVPGTIVALHMGEPVALLERGDSLRALNDEMLPDTIAQLAIDFENARVFASQKRLLIKKPDEPCQRALESAGFVREMSDFVLYRKNY